MAILVGVPVGTLGRLAGVTGFRGVRWGSALTFSAEWWRITAPLFQLRLMKEEATSADGEVPERVDQVYRATCARLLALRDGMAQACRSVGLGVEELLNSHGVGDVVATVARLPGLFSSECGPSPTEAEKFAARFGFSQFGYGVRQEPLP